MKNKFLVCGFIIVLSVGASLGAVFGISKIAAASKASMAQTAVVDKGTEATIVETMRSCVMQSSSQGLTSAGLDQAHRLCWNRAELVGKKHKEK